MRLDQEIVPEATRRAEERVELFVKAASRPDVKLSDDDLRLYEELAEWGWFKRFPIESDEGRSALAMHLAIREYGKIKWAKDHPPKPKPSKWEVVTGRRR